MPPILRHLDRSPRFCGRSGEIPALAFAVAVAVALALALALALASVIALAPAFRAEGPTHHSPTRHHTPIPKP
jgi:hypothetical protein